MGKASRQPRNPRPDDGAPPVGPGPADVAAAVRAIRGRTALVPRLAFVLGSGFQAVERRVRADTTIPYADLPGFAVPGVAGHAGRLVVGEWAGRPVAMLCGRAHYYEGHSLAVVTFPIRVLAALGVEAVVLTNAAGAINRRFRAGEFMLVRDHVNFMGANPLRGPVAPGRARFVDLSATYDAGLQRALRQAARQAGVRLRRGVYLAVPGPNYETPAEIRAFARLGADAVGMSTVPEAIVARQCGLRVAAVSCLTNLAAGRGGAVNHAEVLAAGRRRGGEAARWLTAFVESGPSPAGRPAAVHD
jgi:inosine/guanosine/xanthosine phosphorylase family protein